MPGQTLSEIRALLAQAGLAPRHRFGQNFLIYLNLMRKLVAAAALHPNDVVLEIGAGTGSLTELLLESRARVIAVEIDNGLHALLSERVGNQDRLTLLHGDVLAGKNDIHPNVLSELRSHVPRAPGCYKLAANLPYQVATPLLLELLRGRPRFEMLVCTIQKEVAERLTAAAGTAAYGPISVVAQTLSDVRMIAAAPPAAFWPRPKVDSAMLALTRRNDAETGVDDVDAFVRLVRAAFLHRRQMMRRIVARWRDPGALSAMKRAQIDPNARPQDIAPAAWRDFARQLRGLPG